MAVAWIRLFIELIPRRIGNRSGISLHTQLAEDDICPVHIFTRSYTLKVSMHAYVC